MFVKLYRILNETNLPEQTVNIWERNLLVHNLLAVLVSTVKPKRLSLPLLIVSLNIETNSS